MLISEINHKRIRVAGGQNAYFLFARIAFLGFILALVLIGISYAQNLDVPSAVNSPERLAGWFAKNFQYEFKLTDAYQTPAETVTFKKGNCEDFALLAQAVLNNLGIKSEVAVIKFRCVNLLHAICIWKDKAGLYSFFSNQELCRTGKTDIREAMVKFYPDVESIIYSNQNICFTKPSIIIASSK